MGRKEIKQSFLYEETQEAENNCAYLKTHLFELMSMDEFKFWNGHSEPTPN